MTVVLLAFAIYCLATASYKSPFRHEFHEDSFLVEPGNSEQFSDKLLYLMRDINLHEQFGQKAFEHSFCGFLLGADSYTMVLSD